MGAKHGIFALNHVLGGLALSWLCQGIRKEGMGKGEGGACVHLALWCIELVNPRV